MRPTGFCYAGEEVVNTWIACVRHNRLPHYAILMIFFAGPRECCRKFVVHMCWILLTPRIQSHPQQEEGSSLSLVDSLSECIRQARGLATEGLSVKLTITGTEERGFARLFISQFLPSV